MPGNFLDQLFANPHGLGYGPAYPTAPVITYDEYGQPHDAEGNKIQPPADPSLADSLWNIGESPARVATAFAGALSPYGQEGWQVPPAIHEPINALMRLGQNSRFDDGRLGIPNPQNPENQNDVLTGLLSLHGGNALNPAAAIPKGALASSAFRTADHLPMEEASRLARAAEQGFDTSRTWYHGTPDASWDTPRENLFLTQNPGTASSYAEGLGDLPFSEGSAPGVIPAYLRGNYFDPTVPEHSSVLADAMPDVASLLDNRVSSGRSTWPTLEQPDVQDWIKSNGFDGIVVREGGRDNRMVFDPSNVRSPNAAFDPARTNDAGLLLSDTGKPSILGAAVAGAENGSGRVLYHGAREPFDTFDMSRVGTGSGNDGFYGRGAYLTADADYANEMAGPGGVTLGFQASADKPFSIDYADFPDAVRRAAEIYPDHPLPSGGFIGRDKISGWTDALKRNGYDAVEVRYPEGTDHEWVALDPTKLTRVFSDNRPSLWGSALSQDQNDKRNSFFNY